MVVEAVLVEVVVSIVMPAVNRGVTLVSVLNSIWGVGVTDKAFVQ